MKNERKVAAIAQWHGSCRASCERIGRALGDLVWCGVPFAGGMPELPYIRTRTGVANDLHRHLINLARVIRTRPADLVERLDAIVFHPDELAAAQDFCLRREVAGGEAPALPVDGDLDWAVAYFAATWMTRGGNAGTKNEFSSGLSMRFSGGGGGSAVRFRSAIDSILGWSKVLDRWEFSTLDVFEFLDKVDDVPSSGLYLDPPWPNLGKNYAHRVNDGFHDRLAARLLRFEKARIVVRYGNHPTIVKAYPKAAWTWESETTRNSGNKDVDEVLLVRRR
jgi:site-specific DNA-adenine methylase